MTSGFRINSGGAHLAYGVDPDIAVFAKAIANVFPMAAIVGRAPVMDAAQETLFSSTAWTERVGPVEELRFVDESENAVYWYFVLLAWLPIYGVIYWAPRLL